MARFMDEDFLLSTKTAKWLYHDVAEKVPIIDYHCHINPREIAEDRKFDSITQVWLGGDHYILKDTVLFLLERHECKLTRMQLSFLNKFGQAFLADVIQQAKPLTLGNADAVYDKANELLKGHSARKLMDKFHVKAICTTDDPIDSLHWHQRIADDPTMTIKVLPAFRPDKAINIEKPGFAAYIKLLSEAAGRDLNTAENVAAVLVERINYFHDRGCLCADHGLDYCMFAPPDRKLADDAFQLAMRGEKPSKTQADAYKTLVTIACAKRYAELDWVMQIHFGCLRDNNKPQFALLGSDTGYDAVNSRSGVENLSPLLNAFVENDGLPKMILYSLNPTDNTAIATIMACFQGGGTAGKLQQGSAWWFNDNRPGMRAQLTDLAANGVLGRFVGMLTDSRSFLSYPRHEYFRRVLCELIGEWVESGQYPNDYVSLTKLVEDLCFNNTNDFFRFGVSMK